MAVHHAPRGLDSFYPFAPAFWACSFHPHTCHLVVTTWLFRLPHPICIPGKNKDKREGKRQMAKGQPPSNELCQASHPAISAYISLARTISQAALGNRGAGMYKLLARHIYHLPHDHCHPSSVSKEDGDSRYWGGHLAACNCSHIL